MIKYVFMLTLDALSYEKIDKSVCPTIYELSQKGINCENAFSNGQPTQMAFPSIFSSTLPLDCYGYDRGVLHRKVTLPEVMKLNGFHTVGFSGVNFLGKYYAYNRGYYEFYELYNIKRFWASFHKNYLSYYIKLLEESNIDFKQFCETVGPSIKNAYEYILLFCEEKQNEEKQKKFGYTAIVYGYNFRVFREQIASELNLLNIDDKRYLSDYAELLPRYNHIVDICRHGDGKWGALKAYIDNMCEQSMIRLQNKIGLSYPYMLKRYDHFVNAEYLKNSIVKWVDNFGKKPFFLWAHFLDIHEGNYTSKKVQCPPLNFSFWQQRYSAGKKAFRRFHTEYATNAALYYVDRQIESLLCYLSKKRILDQSLIVISADHGMESCELVRSGHKATQFYDEFIKVPMIFYNPHLKPTQVANLCSHIDLAPTVLGLLGIRSNIDFDGVSVDSCEAENCEYVLIENAGRGPCDIGRKKINIAVRTKRYKFIWQEGDDASMSRLYDLVHDPDELVNIVDTGHMVHRKKYFCGIVLSRWQQIYRGWK